MKMPKTPPSMERFLMAEPQKVAAIRQLALFLGKKGRESYFHWDELRHRPAPEGHTHEEWWFCLKLQRQASFKRLTALLDTRGRSFVFNIPDAVQEALHLIDASAGSAGRVREEMPNAHLRDQYLIRSLMEEAITSSQLEGAVTTREAAKEMIRAGRPPRDKHERMILNNYITMRRIVEICREPLTPEMVFSIHRQVTEGTLDKPDAAGRFRRADEDVTLSDLEGEVYHRPPPAAELPERLAAMCRFANGEEPGGFVHPVIRAIILHFWLAYEHPFVDGNGRTARALFYWSMLGANYRLFEFASISNVLAKAPTRYAQAFLYTETDENDLTYFILAQTAVMRKALEELHRYIERKKEEGRQAAERLAGLERFNDRQRALLIHALNHPYQLYTIESHRKSHDTVYQTARTDLLGLRDAGVLRQKKAGRKMVFTVPPDLAERLRERD